jgi:hypothetical protein|tara:strand:+ start:1667 stop:1909 length:243 start_codon:yes stop_codon:yes gene_type:complete
MNKFTHKLDSMLDELPVSDLLVFYDRLVDRYDHDSYSAAQELDELTIRGSDTMSRSTWLEVIVKSIRTREIQEHDYFQPT